MSKYIDRLKDMKIQNPDFDNLLEKIEKRTQKRNMLPRLALAGSLAAMLIVFGLYFYSDSQGQNESIMAYVMDQNYNNNQDPILDFVFEE
ncbi:MAG: hypothetical protein HQ564_03720 [Candidatus Saganbacteria bacterium]|nr:hypothetical protein [Candidatus Saganbacteria bacterium]